MSDFREELIYVKILNHGYHKRTVISGLDNHQMPCYEENKTIGVNLENVMAFLKRHLNAVGSVESVMVNLGDGRGKVNRRNVVIGGDHRNKIKEFLIESGIAPSDQIVLGLV